MTFALPGAPGIAGSAVLVELPASEQVAGIPVARPAIADRIGHPQQVRARFTAVH